MLHRKNPYERNFARVRPYRVVYVAYHWKRRTFCCCYCLRLTEFCKGRISINWTTINYKKKTNTDRVPVITKKYIFSYNNISSTIRALLIAARFKKGFQEIICHSDVLLYRKITWRWSWLNNKAKLKPCAVFKAISKSSKLEAIPREVTAHLQPIRVIFNRVVQHWVCNSVNNITCTAIVFQAVLNISNPLRAHRPKAPRNCNPPLNAGPENFSPP